MSTELTGAAPLVGVPPAPAEAAEVYVEALMANGVEVLYLNPGTDTFPIQEAMARLAGQGRPIPRVVLCPHEGVALAAAHGYYAATGRPQAVLVHVDVGTQNLGAMLHNAQRGHAAVVITAGRAPLTSTAEVRGTRDDYINWLQEQPDQHGIVRNYVKWDYEVRRADQIGEALSRAFQMAASDPPGPVYLSLPREVIMADAGQVGTLSARRSAPARLGAGDPQSLRLLAEWLVRAERPVVLTGTSGRTPAGLAGLSRLVDVLALPVVEWRERVNLPANHVCHQGYGHGAPTWLADADVVLVVDHDVPYIPTRTHIRPDARIAQIDLDPIKERIPLWSFPLDLAIKADSAAALPLLADYAGDALGSGDRERLAARRADLGARGASLRAEWRRAASRAADVRPIAPAWLGACLDELRRGAPDVVFVDETVTNTTTLMQQIATCEPGTWFKSGGSGLGWGLGAAIGVAQALPGRPTLALVGDGSFIFGTPLAALWTARAHSAAILVVVLNNGGYAATRAPLLAAYPNGASARTDTFFGIDLEPPPRFDLEAASVDAYGERIEDPSELLAALRRGLEHVRGGQSAVLDVILARPGAARAVSSETGRP